ncbi:MAG: ammonium transporter, partial [Actinomycetes bacterium]
PNMIVYLGLGKNPSISGAGLFYGHGQPLAIQAGAALTIIIWDGVVTFILLKAIGLVVKLRIPDDQLEIGDVAVHGEEAYPADELISVSTSRADEISPPSSEGKVPEKAAKSADGA